MCRVALTPDPRRKRRKEQNTKRRGGEFQEILFKFAKTVSKEQPRKNRKNPPHRSRKAILGNEPNSNPKCDTPVRQKYHKLVLARKKCEKRHFQSDLSSAAPSRFLPSKPNLVKYLNFREKTIKTRKNDFQKNCAESRRSNLSKRSSGRRRMPNRSETPCFEAFRVFYLFECAVKSQDGRDENKNRFCQAGKKPQKDLQDGILGKKRFHPLLTIIDIPRNAAPPFRTTKTVLSKRRGLQINSSRASY